MLQRFSDADIIIYSSKARGDDEETSGIHLLIFVKSQVNRKPKEEITEITSEMELNILNN